MGEERRLSLQRCPSRRQSDPHHVSRSQFAERSKGCIHRSGSHFPGGECSSSNCLRWKFRSEDVSIESQRLRPWFDTRRGLLAQIAQTGTFEGSAASSREPLDEPCVSRK